MTRDGTGDGAEQPGLPTTLIGTVLLLDVALIALFVVLPSPWRWFALVGFAAPGLLIVRYARDNMERRADPDDRA